MNLAKIQISLATHHQHHSSSISNDKIINQEQNEIDYLLNQSIDDSDERNSSSLFDYYCRLLHHDSRLSSKLFYDSYPNAN